MPSLSVGPIGPESGVHAPLDDALDGPEDACVRALAATSIWAIIANVKGTYVIAAVLTVALSLAGRVISADEVVVELVGFLGNLPAGEVRLPLSGVTTARLEVPNELGGSRVAFTVEFTMHTEFARDAGRLRDQELVVLEGVLRPGRLWARRIHEVDIAEYGGRLALRDGPLDLPVTTDRLVEIFLDGAKTLPVTFLLTPGTSSRQSKLSDGQAVTIAVVTGRRVVVGIEATSPR